MEGAARQNVLARSMGRGGRLREAGQDQLELSRIVSDVADREIPARCVAYVLGSMGIPSRCAPTSHDESAEMSFAKP